jgi:hypothetical protein
VTLHTVAGVTPANGSYGLHHFAILLPDRSALGRFGAHLAPSMYVSGRRITLSVRRCIYGIRTDWGSRSTRIVPARSGNGVMGSW